MTHFATLYSGSSGNSAYIRSNDDVLLIDCGKRCKITVNSLYAHNLPMKKVAGILLTHEHRDHIAGLAVLLKHYSVPVYGPPQTLSYLLRTNSVPPHAKLIDIKPNQIFDVASFKIKAFQTSHDSLGAYGYTVTTKNNKKIGYATDTGIVTPTIYENLKGCHFVALESNYDQKMLEFGPYPGFLKRRILSKYGHLSNDESAATIVRLLNDGTKGFMMCHMSRENNTGNAVFETIQTVLTENGRGADMRRIHLAHRNTPSSPINIERL